MLLDPSYLEQVWEGYLPSRSQQLQVLIPVSVCLSPGSQSCSGCPGDCDSFTWLCRRSFWCSLWLIKFQWEKLSGTQAPGPSDGSGRHPQVPECVNALLHRKMI